MKRSFMKRGYDSYYVQLPSGETVETTRERCFAQPYGKNQRWYWDEDGYSMAVRLTPNEIGKAIGNYHASNLRAEERRRLERMQYEDPSGLNHDSSERDDYDKSYIFEPTSPDDPYLYCEAQERREALSGALSELTVDERDLWNFLADGKTEREIAAKLCISQMGVNKRKVKLFAKLAENAALSEWYS